MKILKYFFAASGALLGVMYLSVEYNLSPLEFFLTALMAGGILGLVL